VLAVFLVLSNNLESLLARWGSVAEMSVYFRDDASAADQAAVERTALESGLVAGREYVSKAEAVRRFKRDFPDLASSADTAAGNPFPASLEVRLRPGQAGDAAVERLAAALTRAPGVADVRYDRRWLDRLARLTEFVRWTGFVLAGVLILAAALTVASVVRLGLHERRDEIEIMDLVGAPGAYVRGPFVVEGIIEGGVGAILALLMAWGGFVVFAARYASFLAELVDLSTVRFLPWATSAVLVLGGMLVGCVGGYVATRRVAHEPAGR
jgi:cell division transport system permease protein